MGVADTYLASFRPVQPIAGFDDVLSDTGMTALGIIPQQNSKLGFDLASAALQQAGVNARQEMVLDATRRENDLNRKSNRKFAGMKLASALLGSAMPGSQGLGKLELTDPVALATGLGSYYDNLLGRTRNMTVPSSVYVKKQLEELG